MDGETSEKAEVNEERETAIAELEAALAELESGEGLSRFAAGHGLMSRWFEFRWSEPALEIDFRLPYARVLADEDSQKEDDSEIGAAIRMAILLLTVEGRKSETLEGMSVRVWADEGAIGYSIRDGEENEVDSGEDWNGLIHRLETAFPDGEAAMSVIWP